MKKKQLETRKRGKTQRDGRRPLFYSRRTFVASCENFVTMTTGVGWGPVLMIAIPLNRPNLVQVSGSYLQYTGQVIANFVIKYPNFCYRGNGDFVGDKLQ